VQLKAKKVKKITKAILAASLVATGVTSFVAKSMPTNAMATAAIMTNEPAIQQSVSDYSNVATLPYYFNESERVGNFANMDSRYYTTDSRYVDSRDNATDNRYSSIDNINSAGNQIERSSSRHYNLGVRDNRDNNNINNTSGKSINRVEKSGKDGSTTLSINEYNQRIAELNNKYEHMFKLKREIDEDQLKNQQYYILQSVYEKELRQITKQWAGVEQDNMSTMSALLQQINPNLFLNGYNKSNQDNNNINASRIEQNNVDNTNKRRQDNVNNTVDKRVQSNSNQSTNQSNSNKQIIKNSQNHHNNNQDRRNNVKQFIKDSQGNITERRGLDGIQNSIRNNTNNRVQNTNRIPNVNNNVRNSNQVNQNRQNTREQYIMRDGRTNLDRHENVNARGDRAVNTMALVGNTATSRDRDSSIKKPPIQNQTTTPTPTTPSPTTTLPAPAPKM